MKNLIFVFLLVSLMVSFSSCSKFDNPISNNEIFQGQDGITTEYSLCMQVIENDGETMTIIADESFGYYGYAIGNLIGFNTTSNPIGADSVYCYFSWNGGHNTNRDAGLFEIFGPGVSFSKFFFANFNSSGSSSGTFGVILSPNQQYYLRLSAVYFTGDDDED